jgi:hypothetical protein
VGEASAEADLTKESPPDFKLAGHTVGSTVCPPSAVCITEDVYFFLLHASPVLVRSSHTWARRHGMTRRFLSRLPERNRLILAVSDWLRETTTKPRLTFAPITRALPSPIFGFIPCPNLTLWARWTS